MASAPPTVAHQKMSEQTEQESGGDQYIHAENSDRQTVLNSIFWPSTHYALDFFGIKKEAMEAEMTAAEPFRILEIGCGSGATTFNLAATMPNNVEIIGMDTSLAMIESAKEKLKSMPEDIQRRVQFLHKAGERAATEYANAFDVVWLRFVVIHVPRPLELLQAAKDSLKIGGKLFVEDCDSSGHVTDPPNLGIDQLHALHIRVSKELGADVERGRMIGSYFHALNLNNIRCNSYVPLYGRGVEIPPWIDEQYETMSQEEKYQLGIQMANMSRQTLAPKFLEVLKWTQDELDKATESILDLYNADYQIFSIPGGKIFQWIGTKGES